MRVRARLGSSLAAGLIAGMLLSCASQGATRAEAGPIEGSPGAPGLASKTSGPSPDPSDAPTPDARASRRRTNARIVRVIDGDTVEARYRGRIIDMRLIGVDTPETVHPSEPVGCYGPAASSFTERGLEGRQVRLTFDVERVDRFGRTLAYIWLGRDLFNQRLVRAGYASVATYPPNVRYVGRFLAAQRSARSHDRGLWGACSVQGSNGGGTGGGGGGSCDPSYPDACIPPYPPDLDCADVNATDFRVMPPDDHGFDGDGDGRGCET